MRVRDNYSDFTLEDNEIFPEDLPTHITVIEEKPTFRRVDLDGMKLPAVRGNEINLRLRDIEDLLTPATAQIYFAVALHALNGNRKVGTVLQWCARFERVLRKRGGSKKVASITLKMYLAEAKDSSANSMKTLRSFLKYWIRLRYPGIAMDLKVYILTSQSPKPDSHIAIQAKKKHERPFSIEQVRAIHRQVDDLYIAGTFSPQDNLLWRLLISEALRPAQLQLLRVGDVSLATGSAHAKLRVPMVKLHGKPARSHMTEVDVADAVGVALRDHLAWVRSLLGTAPLPELPLFSVNKKQKKAFQVQARSVAIIGLITRSRMLIAGHKTELKDIDLFARRFKHTKLTHLAMLGAPLEVLMHAAFHTSSGSLVRYVNLTDELMDAFERRMDAHFEFVEGAFRGAVVKENERASIPDESIILSSDMDDELGGCAAIPCGILAPYGCYVCPRFKPFDDGPHETVLQEMEAKRQEKVEMGLPAATIKRDDELISAAKKVIMICEEIRR